MKPAPFKYVGVDTAEEALDVLASHGGDARVIAGGQSLGALLNLRLVRPSVLVDIMKVEDLRAVRASADSVLTGATLSQADAMRHPTVTSRLALLARALPHVGHYQTRNRGTVGGSVAHADPSAEIPLALLVSGGSVVLSRRRARREVPADEFFVAPLVTDRRDDELVTGLRWKTTSDRSGCAFHEVATRDGDFALVSCACIVTLNEDDGIEHVSLGFGGVGDRPLLADTRALRGLPAKEIDAALQDDLDVPGMHLRNDIHATRDYRGNLVRVLGRRTVLAAAADAAVQELPHA